MPDKKKSYKASEVDWWTPDGCESCVWHVKEFDLADLYLFWNTWRLKWCANPSYEALKRRHGNQ